jgi:hypothetical protein
MANLSLVTAPGRGLLALVLSLAAACGVRAQGIESVLSPGRVIQAHAKWENECAKCHVRFDRKGQDRVCMDCHKEIGQDVRGRTGYHGRMEPQACRGCHTDHKGPQARIIEFDPQRFDHGLADFALRGKHAKARCEACHEPAKKYRQAASDCVSCHRKDDVHKGSLGPKCADCHTENSWKEAKFDHSKTAFPLTGRHIDARCADCHRNKANYKDTPRTCNGCHKKDDDGPKGHKGRHGEKCGSCHDTRAWQPSTFNHDTATKYPLRGQHRSVKCGSCHTAPLYDAKPASDCHACHRKDDKHKGTLGTDCARCHTERDWKGGSTRFDHDKTAFPLRGKHTTARCESCHKSTLFKEAPKDCIGCHRSDDKHEGTLGDKCGDCHTERDWKNTSGRFDHDKTGFRLRNAHAAPKVECKACHKDLKSLRRTAKDCDSCHRKDDRHDGQQGRQCEQCHDDKSWKVPGFNHARTRFPLVGRHALVVCKDCHATPRFKDAPRECYGCHKKDDKHKLAFGMRCDSCHNERAWSLWEFDHDRRTRYPLDPTHRKLACASCHTQPAPAGKDAAPVGNQCVACHRKDDVHDGGFGPACQKCHVTETWKKVSNRTSLRQPFTPDLARSMAGGLSCRLSRLSQPRSPWEWMP